MLLDSLCTLCIVCYIPYSLINRSTLFFAVKPKKSVIYFVLFQYDSLIKYHWFGMQKIDCQFFCKYSTFLCYYKINVWKMWSLLYEMSIYCIYWIWVLISKCRIHWKVQYFKNRNISKYLHVLIYYKYYLLVFYKNKFSRLYSVHCA